jgi:hypothetical protein
VSGTRERAADPWTLDDGSALLDAGLDLARTACLPEADSTALARAIAAMANSRGGDIVVGATTDPTGRVVEVAGIRPEDFAGAVARAVEQVDPPVTHLLRQTVLPAGGRMIGLLQVRLSPSAPHLVTTDGAIYRIGERGVRPIGSRRALDDLYARGRGERERADRLVEAMLAKLALGHYAFYSLAIVACTQQPSAEPFRRAQTERHWLAPLEDPFVAAWALHEQEPHLGPAEIELRAPGEQNGYIRVTRSGCVAVGEVQRRPYHEELDTSAQLEARVERLVRTVARLLAVATDPLILPHIFIEGVRGLRLVRDPEKRVLSANAPQDTARHALTVGDARDEAYVASLPGEAMSRLASLFP